VSVVIALDGTLIRRTGVVVRWAAGAGEQLADAWFDAVTSRRNDEVLALLLAVFVERPPATLAVTVAARASRRLTHPTTPTT